MLLAVVVAVCLPQATNELPQSEPPKVHAVVLTGANNHEWPFTSKEIAAALDETGRFAVTIETDPAAFLQQVPSLVAGKRLDVLVLDYNGPRWGDAAERAFVDAVRAGLGVCVVHAANNAFPGWAEYEQMVGLLWREGTGHGAYHPFDVHVVDPHHPITAGMADLRIHPDELYHRLALGKGAEFRVLLSAFSDGKTGGTGRHEPMATASTFGAGRVFHTPLGHTWTGVPASRATWADPQLRHLVARGTEWAATSKVTIGPVPLNRLSEQETAEGFVPLFDGLRITEWRAYRGDAAPKQGWIVRDAAIVHTAAGGGGDLVTQVEFTDFDFRFSFRVAPGANSGVIWHVLETAEQTYMTGPEYQVIDDLATKPDPRHATGALYDLVAAGGAVVRPAGAWNDGRIVVHAGRVQHWCNGVRVVDAPCTGPEWQAMVAGSKFRGWPFGNAARGRIALQDHGDEVAFRNLRVLGL